VADVQLSRSAHRDGGPAIGNGGRRIEMIGPCAGTSYPHGPPRGRAAQSWQRALPDARLFRPTPNRKSLGHQLIVGKPTEMFLAARRRWATVIPRLRTPEPRAVPQQERLTAGSGPS